MLFTISILGLTISLLAWQLWKESEKAQFLGVLTLVFIVFSSLLFIKGFSVQRLGLLAVSLLSLALLSSIASTVRHISILKIPYLAVSCFAMWNILLFMPKSTFPILSIQSDPTAEILVKVRHDQVQSFEAFAQSVHTITVSPAFDPMYQAETELDDYFTVDILGKPKGASPQEIDHIIELLRAQPEVLHVEVNEQIDIPSLQRSKIRRSDGSHYLFFDPLSKDQWALEQTNMNEVFKIIKSNKPENKARLFILDTGVDSQHPDIKDIFVKTEQRNDKDVKGHGTHCAGIAGAMTGNHLGISSYNAEGIFEVSSIKVLADFGGGTQQGIINGMIKAIDQGADVISMSLGGRSNDSRQKAYNEVIEYAERNNVIVIVAAGNSNQNAKFYSPANSKGVITVAAVDQNLQKASFSNTLEDIEMGISAPGVDILSTFPKSRYERFSGTSMATPYVAGLVTLMKCYKPDLTSQEAFQLLSDTGIRTQDNQIKEVINPGSSLNELLKK